MIQKSSLPENLRSVSMVLTSGMQALELRARLLQRLSGLNGEQPLERVVD
jgi:hypothetical protein